MKLDYATLISPYTLYIPNIGHVKSPTLREIWNPDITYQKYTLYISMLLMTPQSYFEKINPGKLKWFESLSNEDRANIAMFDIISSETELQIMYRDIFNFFFEENFIWDNDNKVYIAFKEISNTENSNPVITGMIHKNIFYDVSDIILQRCGIERNEVDVDISKTKSNRALEIAKKLQNGRRKKSQPKHDADLELPNMIAKLSVMAKSINYTNIWDLTVFQLQEHFKQECLNVYFNVNTMSVAAWGNEKKTFTGNEWYKTNTQKA